MLARILAVALFVLLVAAAPAAAVDIPVAATCGDLQSKMDTAESDPLVTNHHVITLSGICTTNYDLPDFPTPVMSESYRFFTLKGDRATARTDSTAPA